MIHSLMYVMKMDVKYQNNNYNINNYNIYILLIIKFI